jgi:enoyl-CoA hydratase/carnithine racemase
MPVRLEKEAGIGRIVLDRPPANSYDYGFLRELGTAVDAARFDDEVRALLVESASPRFFSAGADITAFRSGGQRQRSMTVLLAHEVFRKLEQTPLLVVAAVAGHCLGGGLELAMACDLRFAARGEYRLGLPEVGLGLIPGSGGTQRLPRLVGLGRGIDLIATARTFGPEEALELGVVDRLLDDPDACRRAALDYCAGVAVGAAEAIGRAKVAASLGFGATMDAGLAIEREAITSVFATEDAAEGIAAFAEKRKPSFKGR